MRAVMIVPGVVVPGMVIAAVIVAEVGVAVEYCVAEDMVVVAGVAVFQAATDPVLYICVLARWVYFVCVQGNFDLHLLPSHWRPEYPAYHSTSIREVSGKRIHILFHLCYRVF